MAQGQKYERKTKQPDLGAIGAEVGLTPPQALDVEEAVLGALLLEPNIVTDALELLNPGCFYKEANRKIFEAIRVLSNRHDPVDILTVAEELTKTKDLELVGGRLYLSEISLKIGAAAHIDKHIHILLEKYIQRELISLSYQVQKDAFDNTVPVDDLLDSAQSKLLSIAERDLKRETRKLSDVIDSAIGEIEEAQKHDDGLSGLASGYSALDEITLGWQASDLVILAARPSMGKTAFVLNMARNMAVDYKTPVAFFSLEMSSLSLVRRMMVSETGLAAEKIRGGKRLTADDWERLNDKISALTKAPIWVDDTPSLSISEFRSKARKLVVNAGVKIIILDYLQLMTGPPELKGIREQEVASISRSLKSIAKELNVPIIALSQLSRSVETRGGERRPMLSDLRESGSIEQDADLVIFINRQDYYAQDKPEKSDVDIIIAKHRNGKVGDVPMTFISSQIKFVNRELLSFDSESVPQEMFSSTESRMNSMDIPTGTTFE